MNTQPEPALVLAGLLLAPLVEPYNQLKLAMDRILALVDNTVIKQAELKDDRVCPLEIQDIICAVEDLPASDEKPILIVVHYRCDDMVFQTSAVVPKIAVYPVLNHVMLLEEELRLASLLSGKQTEAFNQAGPRPTFKDAYSDS